MSKKSADKKTFLLLDGNALLHRAWHALPQSMTTKDGTIVNAVYGFARVLENMLDEFQPDYMAVAWDVKGKTFRHDMYKKYKAQRKKKAQELYDQIPMIQEVLDAFGLPWLEAKGFEADDIIATLETEMDDRNDVETLVVTGDLDALQMVDDDTKIVFFQRGISQTKIYDEKAVEERYGLRPDQLVDFKALRGDPSDNIPGVSGIGKVTAQKLLQKHGTIEGLLEALENGQVEEKYAKKLRGNEEEIKLSKQLVQLVQDVPLAFEVDDATVEAPDTKELRRLYRTFGFRSLLKKYESTPATRSTKTPDANVAITREASEVESILNSMSDSLAGLFLTQQPEDLFGSTLSAVAVSDGEQTIVIPNPQTDHMDSVRTFLSGVARIVVHDWKAMMHATGWTEDDRFFDTHIASYLLHPGSRGHDIGSIAFEYLDTSLPDIPETATTQREQRAIGTICSRLPALGRALDTALDEHELKEVFMKMEMPLVPILYKMETNGIKLDTKMLKAFSAQLKKEIDGLTKRIHDLAGTEFNINSPQQLAEILFDTLELPTKGIKKTKTTYSTAASELEKLKDKHEIIPLISDYRELTKLRSTYVDALPELVAQDGRLHTTFNQTVTATGRLSSSNPNLQNIPIKTARGREIRKAFVAEKGKRLIAADYSQIELRLVAVIAKDQAFIRAFQEGADIHTRTAAEIFDIAESDVTKKQRRAAKAINFGIIYGMGPRSLSASTDLSYGEAKEFIDKYFQIHHAVRDYLDETIVRAHQNGYVETLFGRRRSLPGIESGARRAQAAAERMAINMPVQGTAADIMKLAMINVHGWLSQSDWPAQLLLQVHDELVLEVDKDMVEPVAAGVRDMMEQVADYEVPLDVDISAGKNWGAMESLELAKK